MTFEAFFTLFCGIALLAAKPGPGMMTVATKAMGEGLEAVGSFMVGTNFVKIAFFTLVVFGYGLLPERAIIVSIILKALTGLYLIWLGIEGFKKLDPDQTPNHAVLKKDGFIENFTAGFMLTISNPFDILFFAGVLPNLFKSVDITAFDFTVCAITIVLADSLVALSYAVPIALSRRFFNKLVIRKLNIVSSIGLIIVGLIIGASALPAKDILAAIGLS